MTDCNCEYDWRQMRNARDHWYNKCQELEAQNMELDDKLTATENELKPLKKDAEKSYDAYVLNGGGDPCFSNGMAGNCGEGCEKYDDGTCENMDEQES